MADDSHIAQTLATLDRRVAGLETWRNDQNTSSAVRAERDKHLDKRFDKLEKDVGEVKGYLLKIVWVIILGILGSFVTFIVSGGLSLVP
jgi:hypothetical protein